MELTDKQKQLLEEEYDKYRVMTLLANCSLNEDLIMQAYKANDLLQPIIHDGDYIYIEISDTLKILIQIEDRTEWEDNDLKWYRLYRKQHKNPQKIKVNDDDFFEAIKIVVKLLAHFNTDDKLVHNWNHISGAWDTDEELYEECILFPYEPEKMFLIKKLTLDANNENSHDFLDLG